jgi:prepilin-type N-terminal cleavage/methylation domain-containing protein
MKLRRQISRAFTLLEVMVAIALLAMVVAAIYASWNSILKGTKVALDVAAAAQRTRITMRALKDSLLCACMYNQNGRYYAFLADADGDYASLSFVARLPKSFPRSGKFGDLDVRRLNFTVENSPDGGKRLVLRQNALLMDPDKDEVENPLVLARDVNKFIVEFIDPQTGDWISEWANTNRLPREVRLTVALGHLDQFSSRPQEALVGTVALPAQPVRVEWQMPITGPAGVGGLNGSSTPGSSTPVTSPGQIKPVGQ